MRPGLPHNTGPDYKPEHPTKARQGLIAPLSLSSIDEKSLRPFSRAFESQTFAKERIRRDHSTFRSYVMFLGNPEDLSSVQFNRSVMSDSLGPHELQHARPPCPSPTPRVHSDSRPSSP